MTNFVVSQSVLRRLILDAFPRDIGLRNAFAYGSVAFPQHGRSTSDSQLDLILVVDDPFAWHSENIKRNPLHYSTYVRPFTSSLLKMLTSGFLGAKVYYNPLVTWFDTVNQESLSVKYGVISMKNILTDLLTWSQLYVAGRLHKPVLWIPVDGTDFDDQQTVQNAFSSAQERNLLAALSFALLQVPVTDQAISEFDLFRTAASISYIGDWRMVIGEDRKKVTRLVTGSARLARFRELYKNAFLDPPINRLLRIQSVSSEDGPVNHVHFDQSPTSSEVAFDLLANLPDSLCCYAARCAKRGTPDSLSRPLLAEICPEKRQELLKRAVRRVVSISSVQQTILGLISAGPLRSYNYAYAKLKKMIQSGIFDGK